MHGTLLNEMKGMIQLQNQLNQLGFKTPFRILDAFTMLHTSKGNRLFPFSIQEIHKQLLPDGNGGEIIAYLITTTQREKGFAVYPADSTEAQLCDAFSEKCRQAYKIGTTMNQ